MMTNFLSERIRKIAEIIDKLIVILNKNGFYAYDNILLSIKEGVRSMTLEELNPIFNTNALFGGAGALWEIYIENADERILFLTLFIDLINNFKEGGIHNKRIDEVQDTLNLILQS